MATSKVSDVSYLIREPRIIGKFKIVYNNPLKKTGYVPEKGSEISVRKIPDGVDELDLLKFFDNVGEIFQLRLLMKEDFTSHRGYCYVTYLNAQAAKNAVDYLGQFELFGNKLLIEQSLNNSGFFICGLPANLTKGQIWQELKNKGFRNVVDVILCRRSSKSTVGAVYVEFRTRENAANTRATFANNLKLWGNDVVVDWTIPEPEIDEPISETVTAIYLKNLRVAQTVNELETIITRYVRADLLQRVYKFRDYAFVHLPTRQAAGKLMERLKEHYKNSMVDIQWARPSPKNRDFNFSRASISPVSSSSSCSSLPEIRKQSPVLSEGSSMENEVLRQRLSPQPVISNTSHHQANFTKTRTVYNEIPGILFLHHQVAEHQPTYFYHPSEVSQFPMAQDFSTDTQFEDKLNNKAHHNCYNEITMFSRNDSHVTEDDLSIIPKDFPAWKDVYNFIGDVL